MIPSKKNRQEWRQLAENTDMVSAVGEYTSDEFIILLDAVDELEETLKFVRYQMQQISLLAHHNGYDFNTDPQKITQIEGDAFSRIENVFASEQAIQADAVQHVSDLLNRILKAIDDEPEFPGVSEKLAQAVAELVIECARISVRETKAGIRARVLAI